MIKLIVDGSKERQVEAGIVGHQWELTEEGTNLRQRLSERGPLFYLSQDIRAMIQPEHEPHAGGDRPPCWTQVSIEQGNWTTIMDAQSAELNDRVTLWVKPGSLYVDDDVVVSGTGHVPQKDRTWLPTVGVRRLFQAGSGGWLRLDEVAQAVRIASKAEEGPTIGEKLPQVLVAYPSSAEAELAAKIR